MQVSKARKGYKLVDTGFGKEVEIPEEWEIKKLGNIIEKIQDGNYGESYPTHKEFIKQGIPFLTSTVITNSSKINFKKIKFITKEKHDELSKAHIKSGDMIFTNRGAKTGAIAIIPKELDDANIGPQLTLLRTKKEITSNEFLYWFFHSEFIKKQIISNDAGSAMNFFGIERTLSFKIFLPELNEQKEITSILSNIDNTLEKTNQLIEKIQILKKGLMQKLLTKGIGHDKFKKVEWLFGKEIEIPEEWEMKKIQDVSNVNQEQINKDYKINEIEYIDISSISDFKIETTKKYSVNERPSRAQRIVRKNNILISTVRPNLKSFTLVESNKENLICSTGFAVVKTKSENNENFIFNYFQSNLFESHYSILMEGASYPAISSKDIEQALIPFPKNQKEQNQIASILSNVDSQINKEKLNKANLELLKKGLMQKLLTGQIRVKV